MIRLLVNERRSQQLTQAALAKRLGIQRPNLARFERGERNPTLDFLIRVAVALGEEPGFILKEMILTLHRLFYAKLDEENAGKCRDIQVFVTGSGYIPPVPDEVALLMQAFVSELNEQDTTAHPVMLAAFAHRRLAGIHPADSKNRLYRSSVGGAEKQGSKRRGVPTADLRM
jgi:transcriptional regulator with XRE-family HTH domain